MKRKELRASSFAGGRRIDILAIDAQGRYVVLELKVSMGFDKVVGQLLRYLRTSPTAVIVKPMDTPRFRP
jgi:RecB family endonuclease NucS